MINRIFFFIWEIITAMAKKTTINKRTSSGGESMTKVDEQTISRLERVLAEPFELVNTRYRDIVKRH